MPSRNGVDSQQGSQLIVELKSVRRGGATGSSVRLAGFLPPRARWLHLLPLACLLVIGVWVPGFLKTLVILLLVLALGAFLLLVQVPVGYLVHRLRALRHRDGTRRSAARGATSNGL